MEVNSDCSRKITPAAALGDVNVQYLWRFNVGCARKRAESVEREVLVQ
jgi:hypothetical protein